MSSDAIPGDVATTVNAAVDELAALRARSLTVLFDLSNKCNLRCRMCYFSYDSVFQRRAIYMAPATFERIARSVMPLAHTVFLSAGSESLTSPHFLEILAIAASFRPERMKLLTNALLLGEAEARALIEHGLTEAHVSVDGASRETYEHIRRGGDFELLRRNLARLKDLKRERGSRLPMVQFNVALMKSTLGELERFVELALELGVEQIATRHLMPYAGLDMESETTGGDPRHANERFHALLEHATRAGVRITSFPDFFRVDGAQWSPPLRAITAEDRAAGLSVPGSPPVDDARPFGRIDAPEPESVEATKSIELAGWALDLAGVASVELRREATVEDDPARVGDDGRVHLGWATIRNGSRPDVAVLFPRVPLAYRSGWTFELVRAALPHGTRAAVHVVAHNRNGVAAELGRREIVFRDDRRAAPFLFCRKPFDNLYIDASGNVYPYPDCQTVDPFGSLVRESSFRKVWFGEEFRELRRRIVERDPPRMCATCPDFINRSVDDPAFFEERPVERDFRRPTGFLDHPGREFTGEASTVTLHGWALGFARVERIEITRNAIASDPRAALRTDGRVLIGLAEPGTDPRPDVARRYARYPGRDRAGWHFTLERAHLPSGGAFDVRATAWNGEGGSAVLGSTRVRFVAADARKREREREVLAEFCFGAVDRPTPDYVAASGRVDVVGWALASGGPPRIVARRRATAADAPNVVGDDGWVVLGTAKRHRKRRPDVVAHFPDLGGGAYSGWKLALFRAQFASDGSHELEFVALTDGGGPTCIGTCTLRFEREFEVTPQAAAERETARRAPALREPPQRETSEPDSSGREQVDTEHAASEART